MNLNKDYSSVWSGKWLADPDSPFSCSFADMRWPSAITKHQPTQQTTGSIRLPHRHTSFPKTGQGSHRGAVSVKMYSILLGRTEREGSRESWCHSLCQALSLGLAAETWLMEEAHATGEGSVGAEDNRGSLGPRNWVLGWSASGSLWVMSAFPVSVATGSQVSCCFVAGFLCDLFF